MSPKQKKEAAGCILLIVMAFVSLFVKDRQAVKPVETPMQTESVVQTESAAQSGSTEQTEEPYFFRNAQLCREHYEKHGKEMGFSSAKEYEQAASAVVNHTDALHKTEAEDGDDVYYLKATNELVIVSKDGYIRTYFCPEDGKAYFDRQ